MYHPTIQRVNKSRSLSRVVRARNENRPQRLELSEHLEHFVVATCQDHPKMISQRTARRRGYARDKTRHVEQHTENERRTSNVRYDLGPTATYDGDLLYNLRRRPSTN
jgi:hypothetical protein